MSLSPRTWILLLIAVLLPRGAAAAADPRPPELEIAGPPSHARLVAWLETFDSATFLPAMELLGLTDPGPPIRVVVAPEGSPAARRAPSWGLAYAVGEAGLVVLLPQRIDLGSAAGADSLDTVLRHEVTHVLIARAARRRPIPRWFNEGLSIYAARGWGLGERTRLVWATFGRGPSLADLDAGFRAGSYRASRAYALAAAFVDYLLDHHGTDAAARILAAVGEGQPFAAAFESATGTTLAATEDRFWSHLDLWHKWVPFVTSSAALWSAITALALVAFRRRRQRDAELRRQWEEEELREELAAATADPWIH